MYIIVLIESKLQGGDSTEKQENEQKVFEIEKQTENENEFIF